MGETQPVILPHLNLAGSRQNSPPLVPHPEPLPLCYWFSSVSLSRGNLSSSSLHKRHWFWQWHSPQILSMEINSVHNSNNLGRVKRIWYLSPMRAAKVQARLCGFRRACASAQSHQSLRSSLIQAVSQDEPSVRKPDP